MLKFCALVLALACCAAAPPQSRILRTFDFEERQLGNVEDLPMHWTKVDGPGMPHYVNGQLATDRRRSGNYSFRLDLNGGSLVYRYDPGLIAVQPRSHYRVETYVQTTALAHARARLTAYCVDPDGRPIASTIRHSELYTSSSNKADEWKPLSVELLASAGAESLVIELALLQPEHYAPDRLGEQTLFTQDIRGSAWFDDVSIAHVPYVRLSTDRPGNIFRRGESICVDVLVDDRSTDDLATQLLIRDAAGRLVYQRSGAADLAAARSLGPSRKRMRIALPELPPGWYEAALRMSSGGRLVGTQKLDLVVLADSLRDPPPDDRFGIIATDLPFEGWDDLPHILPVLGAGRVKLAVWKGGGDVQQAHSAEFDQLLVRLRDLRITPTACLLDPPQSLTRNAPNKSWLQLLQARGDDWQPQLAYMISRHANNLERWQLGADGSDAFIQKPMRRVYRMVYDRFAELVQKPDLAMPWPAWYELEGELPATVALSVPPTVLPAHIPLYMQDIRKHRGHNLSLSIGLLEQARYGREVQIRDLAQRIVYALSAGADRIDIPLPFTVTEEEGHWKKQPQELLMIVRTLTGMLGGATFKGKVSIAEGVEAFLFDRYGQGILALWDRGTQVTPRELAVTLGPRSRAVDLWGNAVPLLQTTPGRQDGAVRLTIGPTPIFLVDIDGELAQLRAGVAIDRPLIESSFVPHTRRIRFTNPYRTNISGSLRLKGPQGWVLNPPSFSFNINPGETFERDLTIEFPYNSFAGLKIVQAHFSIQADQEAQLTVPILLTLGLSDVGMQTLAIHDGRDILVQQMITNYGDKRIDYTGFVIFPNQARQERLITNLDPGRTVMKLYRFSGVKTEPGTRIRAGIKELTGTRILNEEIEVR